MSGRPVHLLAAAAIAAVASLTAASSASAGCYGCGPSYRYAPVAAYTAPVVYSYSYAAPVAYPVAAYASSCGCGYASYGYSSYGYAGTPMYGVNQGPAYTYPTVNAEPTPSYGYQGYSRAYPYYGDAGVRWHRRHWGYRNYGFRGYGYRANRGFGFRHGYRHRYGAVVPGGRFAMRHPMVGPGGMRRGPHMGMHGPRMGMHGPRMGMHRPQMGGPRPHMMHRGPAGSVTPRGKSHAH